MVDDFVQVMIFWVCSTFHMHIIPVDYSSRSSCIEVLLKTRTKDPDCLRFFQEKFWLIQMISTLQTPFISVLDGYARMCYHLE